MLSGQSNIRLEHDVRFNLVASANYLERLTHAVRGAFAVGHRTDSLSAAFNNFAEREELTARYCELYARYGLRASRNNPGASHENGLIEARQGSLTTALDQSLLLRGMREFANLESYGQFVAVTMRRLNARFARSWEVERASLWPLPARRTADFDEVDERVSKFGLISVKASHYSVPSRLIGYRLKIWV
ncbi:hypothetical protein ACSFA3_14445 [Variovorax sp. RHLX14]|uniref:hypothetical protein n=1 Tax=Variovorax sp. RHLX14 TaxID=1259731 RepID=UPI003F45A81A